jgi:hypothetical protein
VFLQLTFQSDWSKTITVRIGKSSSNFSTANAAANLEEFIVHESIIRIQSPLFEAAMGPGWKEVEGRLVRLSDHEQATFQLYLNGICPHTISISLYIETESRQNSGIYSLMLMFWAMFSKMETFETW